MSANMLELFHFDIDGIDKLEVFSQLSNEELANITSIRFQKLAWCIQRLMEDANLFQPFSNALSRSQIKTIDLSDNAFNPFLPNTQLQQPAFEILKQLLSVCSTLIHIEGFNDFALSYQTELMAILNIHHNNYHTTFEEALPAIPIALRTIIQDYVWKSDKLTIPHTIKAVYTIDSDEAADDFRQKYFNLSLYGNFSSTDPATQALKEITEITFRKIPEWFKRFSEAGTFSLDEDLSVSFYADFCAILSKCPLHTINVCDVRLVTGDPTGITINSSVGSILAHCPYVQTINLSKIDVDDLQFMALKDVLSGCRRLTHIGGIDQFTPERQQMLMTILPKPSIACTDSAKQENKTHREFVPQFHQTRTDKPIEGEMSNCSAQQQAQKTDSKSLPSDDAGVEKQKTQQEKALTGISTSQKKTKKSCTIS